jgi:hypothetical protein
MHSVDACVDVLQQDGAKDTCHFFKLFSDVLGFGSATRLASHQSKVVGIAFQVCLQIPAVGR